MPHAPDLSGRALDGRYELHSVIGEGTFGRVYRGRDRRLRRSVAVKVIKPWWAEDPQWVQSFEREAQLLARVSAPGIVQIFDIGQTSEVLYYVAELVDGESLATRLRRGALPPMQACAFAEQLCRALACAHAENVVHRDVKPANVLISADGRIKVGDFGVARLAEGSTNGAAATIAGTPRYMAPEQARGRPTTPATDVYGVGVVLYEMLAGQPPFTERSPVELALRHLQDPPPALPATTPRALVKIVDRALAKNPAERYPDGAAMADALVRAGTARVRDAPPAAGALAKAPTSIVRDGPAAAGARASAPESSAANLSAAEASTASMASTSTRLPSPDRTAATRVSTLWSERRTEGKTGRRRRAAAAAVVLVLLLGGAAMAILTAGANRVTLPALRGLSRAKVTARTGHLHLHPLFSVRYADAAAGIAIAQRPGPGTRVNEGATVRVVLSAGPPPVTLPQLGGQSSTRARAALRGIGLSAHVTLVAAPGVAAGVVTRQSPAAGTELRRGSPVVLSVAEPPRWRELTAFAGEGGGHSVPFRIRGARWQVVYNMAYVGTCTFVLFCSGPTAQVVGLPSGPAVTQFDLGEGSGQTEIFKTGPGVYQVSVAPGSDSARWSIMIEDYY